MTDTQLVQIEFAGTLAIEHGTDRKDETDMFVFVNGVRVVPLASPNKCLRRCECESFSWDNQDHGFETWATLDGFDEIERQQKSPAE